MEPDLSLHDTLKALATHRDQLLEKRGIYRITNYGWKDANTIDSEFAGHAWYQVSPPTQPDWDAMFNGGIPRFETTDQQRELTRNGDDFTNCMLIARHTLGHALCIDETTSWSSSYDDEYWTHIATTTLWLGIATDRLREFITITLHNTTTKKYFSKPTQKQQSWSHPVASVTARDAEEAAHLTTITRLLDELYEYWRERNTVHHHIATHQTQQLDERLQEQQERARTGVPYPPRDDVSFEDFADSVPSYDPFYERVGARERVTRWYHCLASASNSIFVIEQRRRAAAEESVTPRTDGVTPEQ